MHVDARGGAADPPSKEYMGISWDIYIYISPFIDLEPFIYRGRSCSSLRSEELLLAIGGASVYRGGVYICEPDRLPSRPARPQPDHSQTSRQTSNTYLIASCIRAPPVLASLMSSLADHAARQSARRRRSATGRDGSARAMSAEGGPRSDRSSRPLPSRRREGRSRSRSHSP